MKELHQNPGEIKESWKQPEFVPHRLLKNRHLMTIVPGFIPRKKPRFLQSGQARLFKINPDTQLLGHCHWQTDKQRPTMIILHGLEGSAESSHVIGIGSKIFACGFNVIRLNMRNCGGSMQHAKSLYNAGMFEDIEAVMQVLHEEDHLNEFALSGYSLGGNLILNTASRHERSKPYKLIAACAVSPSIDLAHAVNSIERRENRIYQDWFLRTLKQKILAKAKQHPHIYKIDSLDTIKTIREFDDRFTAPHGGYGTAERYYREASSISKIKDISCPVLIISAEDDPLVPVDSFYQLNENSPHVKLLITKHGGHGGFFQEANEEEPLFDRFWAENRVVTFATKIRQVVSK